MILPIFAYGHPVLKKKSVKVSKEYPKLQQLINDMFDTMNAANGVGLAAVQVGYNIQLFVADGSGFEKDELKSFKRVIINPQIVNEWGEKWSYNEGCLSIPGIREDISRPSQIHLKYYDENWNEKEEIFTEIKARIIQHELDHLNGILFTDFLNPLKKQLLKNKLINISKGKVEVTYPVKFV